MKSLSLRVIIANKYVQGAMLASISVLLIILSLEIFLQYFYPDKYRYTSNNYTRFSEYDPYLGWKLKKDTEGRITQMDYSILVKINHEGFRDNYTPQNVSDIMKRIWMIGDSFTFGYGVEEEETFSSILQKYLPLYDIVNMGVYGYATDQEFLLYKKKLQEEINPDIVVLQMFLSNDMIDNLSGDFLHYHKPHFLLTDTGLILTNVPVPLNTTKTIDENKTSLKNYIKEILSQHSRAFNFIDIRYDYLKDIINRKKHAYSLSKKYGTPEELNRSWRITEALIRSFNEISKTNGTKLIIVLIPDKRDFYDIDTNFRKYFDAYERIKKMSNKENFTVIDLYRSFEKVIDKSGIHKIYLLRDAHLNAYGHKIIADEIFNVISKMKYTSGQIDAK